MGRGLESLFRKTGNLFLLGSLIFVPYVSGAGVTSVKVEYKSHIITEDLNDDSHRDEIYVTTEDAPLPNAPGNVVVNDTYQIVLKYWDEKDHENVTIPLKRGIEDDIEKLLLKDMNESHKPEEQRMADLVYIIELHPDIQNERDYRYEIYYFRRTGTLSFGPSEFVRGYDEIPDGY